MTDITAESIADFFKQAADANNRAWSSQVSYFEELVKRNTECFKDLGEARIASFKEISEATTFNQAFESNLSFEEKLREDLADLQEKNTRAWESLIAELTAIYTPPVEPAQETATGTKAPTAKKTASKKAA